MRTKTIIGIKKVANDKINMTQLFLTFEDKTVTGESCEMIQVWNEDQAICEGLQVGDKVQTIYEQSYNGKAKLVDIIPVQ